jgi:hypothetical protein
MVGLPAQLADGSVEVEGAFAFADLSGEELRELVVASVEMKGAVAFDGLFGFLLNAECECADLAMIGRVESFDVAGDGFAFFGRGLLLSDVVGEGLVGAGEVFQAFKEMESSTARTRAFAKSVVFEAELCSAAFVGYEVGFVDEGPELGWTAMEELGAQLDGLTGYVLGEDAAADSVAGLEDGDYEARVSEGAGGGESGDARADDEDVGLVWHQEIRCPVWWG